MDINLNQKELKSFNVSWHSTDDITSDAKSIALEMQFLLEQHLANLTKPNQVYCVAIGINQIVEDKEK